MTAHPRRAARGADEQGYQATPETRAKLRSDVVLKLHRGGRLRLEQLQAAEELRRIWQALGRGLFASAARLDAPIGGASRKPDRDPLGALAAGEEIAYRRRYRPWSRELSIALAGGRRSTRLQLVLDIVVDNLGTRQADRQYGLRHGAALALLQSALLRYAEIAGWMRPARAGLRRASASGSATREPAREAQHTERSAAGHAGAMVQRIAILRART
jgi:hypothetical protein